jgi:hypothetical protein
VYIEEVPGALRNIRGVPTSIAAFIGWAAAGPTDAAQMVTSFSDFDRLYGGLDARSLLGYAVSHFFANGGTQAYVVRVVADDATLASTTIAAAGGSLTFEARNAGDWANAYGVLVEGQPGAPGRIRVQITCVMPGASWAVFESFEDLSVISADPHERFVADVINAGSKIVSVRVDGALSAPPADITTPQRLVGGHVGTPIAPQSPPQSPPPTAPGPFEMAVLPASGSGGVHLLEHVDLFNLLCVPGEAHPQTLAALETFCRAHRAFLIVDAGEAQDLSMMPAGLSAALTGADAKDAALYFPWLLAPDPSNAAGSRAFPPSGFVAGIFARTDATRGVWKSPAGIGAYLTGATGVRIPLSAGDAASLNAKAVNCIRDFPLHGVVVWGARTLHSALAQPGAENYVPVRRLALYIEESLHRGTVWAAFEANAEPLWAQLRLSVGAFMDTLFRDGALQGTKSEHAYFVKCGRTTTTQSDIDTGVVNIEVGFAPLKPAEFVLLRVQQKAGPSR